MPRIQRTHRTTKIVQSIVVSILTRDRNVERLCRIQESFAISSGCELILDGPALKGLFLCAHI